MKAVVYENYGPPEVLELREVDKPTVGDQVTRARPGDAVFGESGNAGAFAEYVCVPESTVAPKPANLSHEEAAAVPVSALTALRRGGTAQSVSTRGQGQGTGRRARA